MRFNKHELFALASQTSHSFDKEGVLAMKERQEGFFRRSEGTVVRWFRLRGNLLFYLKGPEPWHEPLGLIVLGSHSVNLHEQDENGHWPFHIVWDNGVSYRLATFNESDRNLWLSAIQSASHDGVSARYRELKSRLETTRPAIDVTTYRQHKGIGNDMTEIPLCELAVSCDNLVCDALGRPPSPRVVVYVRLSKMLCVRYGATELVEKSSNPCFSRTVAFLASDGLTGDAVVRLVVYDVRERLSGTAVPLGYTSMQLSTIQEAHRLRVALQNLDNKTVGFVTAHAWSVEPAGTSPTRAPPFLETATTSHDLPAKVFCHRRSQSLPPRLGLKRTLPSYSAIFRQNFVNGTTATFRFNSGLGGEIAVHELMAEPVICYQMPIQLLEIYIEHEKDLLEGLLDIGAAGTEWRARQVELASSHVALMKRYCHARSSMMHVDTGCFKPSARKDDASLEFAPVNLHLQRMWVCNDTLNRAGFHDIVTVGAFAAHAHSAERTGGLIRLVQQAKGITDANTAQYSATASKIDAAHECVYATRRLRDGIVADAKEALFKIENGDVESVPAILEDIKSKSKSIMALWDPVAIEETLSSIGWPNNSVDSDENDHQALAAILRFTEALNLNTFDTLEWEAMPSSSSSSKDASPLVEFPPLSSSVPNVCVEKGYDLKFEPDHFGRERGHRLNNSLRSVKAARVQCEPSRSFDCDKMRSGSFRHEFKSSASLEQVSYKGLMDNAAASAGAAVGERRMSRQSTLPSYGSVVDDEIRRKSLATLREVGFVHQQALSKLINDIEVAVVAPKDNLKSALAEVTISVEWVRDAGDVAAKWQRRAAAAQRARSEPPKLTRERAALQKRRDACFSQALTTVSTALTSWLSTVPSSVIVKLLSSGLGPLCEFEGLLSLYSTEKAMWGDMVVAVEDLHTVVFTLFKAGVVTTPYLGGTRDAITAYLPVTEALYNQFTSKKHLSFNITAVFFNMGINEKATLAEALGETAPQHHSNTDNLERLTNYYHKYMKLFGDAKPQQPVAAASSRSRPLEEVMALLRASVHRAQPKNTELLQLASLATRLMYGVRLTSCKSAKDRTGMAVTLEQCAVLTAEYRLAARDMQAAIDAMRSEGCRRENTEKNIGVRKYAFTKKQVMDLPAEYRPPAGTYGSSQT